MDLWCRKRIKTMADTLTFSEKNKGWCGDFDYLPDAMCRLNNRFFMIKDGQLHLANDKSNPIRNNFFGVQYTSKIKIIINQEPSDDKVFKTLVLESNKPWEARLNTNYTESTIKKNEFNKRESRQFAYIRKNEGETGLNGSVQGLGNITAVSGATITLANVSEVLNIGDNLYQINGSTQELIGTISAKTSTAITVSSITTTPVVGRFAFSKKSSRIEGAETRGYYLEVELENDDIDKVELFGIETNVSKSYL